MHLVFNMYVLLTIGPFMERLSGGVSYLVLYLVAGLGGTVASLARNPVTVSAGASGAIFGLYGGLLGFLLWHRNTIPAEALKPLLKGAVIFVGYNLAFGVLQSGIDMAAHIGGLVTGFVLGLFMVRPGRGASETLFNSRVLLAIGLGVVLLFGTLAALPKPDDFSGAYQHFSAVEDATLKLYNSSIDQWRDGKITDEQFLNVLDKEVLPPWKRERQSLASLTHLPPQQARLAGSLIRYLDTRTESWTLLSEALREGDVNKLEQSTAKGKEADELVGRLQSGSQH
jgi:rhomboid protease GluP